MVKQEGIKNSNTNQGKVRKEPKIMLVDDEPDINAALEVVLGRAGFRIDTFQDPSLALEMFKPKMYDLVILDLKMPKMDGFELYEEIKKVDEDTKICFLTASELFYERLRERKYASLDKNLMIQKPIANADLLKKINQILMKENKTIERKLETRRDLDKLE